MNAFSRLFSAALFTLVENVKHSLPLTGSRLLTVTLGPLHSGTLYWSKSERYLGDGLGLFIMSLCGVLARRGGWVYLLRTFVGKLFQLGGYFVIFLSSSFAPCPAAFFHVWKSCVLEREGLAW